MALFAVLLVAVLATLGWRLLVPRVRVEDDDTVETLHERIKVLERDMLVEVVRSLAADRSWQGA